MLYSIPYIAYRGFGFDHLSLFSVLFMQAVLYLSVSIVPLPGAAGVSEGSFVLLFRQLFPANAVAPTMLFSRGISFYFLLILSGLLLLAVRFISEKKIDET